MYRPKNFIVEELVPPDIFKLRGARAWELLDTQAVMTLQSLRDQFGFCTVNNWDSGGHFKESGLRSFKTTTGAAYSQHRYGRAFDCKFREHSPSEVAEYVLAHPEKFPYLTCIESPIDTPTWFHFDTRLHDKSGIWTVRA